MYFFLKKYSIFFAVLFSVTLYFFIGYCTERTSFFTLFSYWIGLFICFYIVIKKEEISFSTLAGIAILFRLIFLFSIPNLSQDFYRFIWDGRMILNGFNPYLSLPETFIQQGLKPISEAIALYEGMGELNGSNYTNYPPLNQFCFFIAAIFAGKNIFGTVVIFRLFLIFADIGIIYFGKKVLTAIHLPVKNIFWYALNPFVIIELTGNLHFESIMLFFLVWGLYKLQQQKWIIAATLFAFSISIKLIPFLFLPLFFKWFVTQPKRLSKDKASRLLKTNRAKSFLNLLIFYGIVLGINAVLFLPFYNSKLVTNYSNSIGLWFKNFEFNASFYYIFREIGYTFRGYNEIAIIGKITPAITLLFLAYLTFFRKNNTPQQLITNMLIGLCFYYFTASTVHPWYIATPLILCVFTKYKFPVIWSLVAVLSYQAYATIPWQENLIIVGIEYLLLFTFVSYEVFKNFKINKF